MNNIKEITAAETYAVRHPVLRSGKPLESCRFAGDELSSTTHFGYFVDEKLVGVASLYKAGNTIFKVNSQFQLRGMAVLESNQKSGVGQRLILHCEEFIEKKRETLLWFNARVIAVPFYEKMGYEKVGEPFQIADVGFHFIMYKSIRC